MLVNLKPRFYLELGNLLEKMSKDFELYYDDEIEDRLIPESSTSSDYNASPRLQVKDLLLAKELLKQLKSGKEENKKETVGNRIDFRDVERGNYTSYPTLLTSDLNKYGLHRFTDKWTNYPDNSRCKNKTEIEEKHKELELEKVFYNPIEIEK